jgi:hypothetical protein
LYWSRNILRKRHRTLAGSVGKNNYENDPQNLFSWRDQGMGQTLLAHGEGEMLKVEYVRNGKNRIIGSRTSGFANGDMVARDRDGKILGRSSSKFGNTRDANGRLTSTNQADADSLFDW